jgi:hypothetical protein
MARSNCALREALVLRSRRQFPPEIWRELPFGPRVSEIDKLLRPTNANRREEFLVGISDDGAIDDAQQIARQVLLEHPAVPKDPEPSVLANGLGPRPSICGSISGSAAATRPSSFSR